MTDATALTAAAMLAALRAVAPRTAGDRASLSCHSISGLLEEAGVDGFGDGLGDLARFESALPADEVRGLSGRLDGEGPGPLGDLYMRMKPRDRRHAAGEYYTPGWLVELVLDRAGFGPSTRLIDPMCGAGAFLAAAVRRLRRDRPAMPAAEIAERIAGCDINPLAVLLARAEYLVALGPPGRGSRIRIPITCADALALPGAREPFDVVAGNPPWVGWENLDPETRERTKHLWSYHGLFTPRGARRTGESGMETLLGAGKKDLCMLATYAAAESLLKTGGRLSFVIAQSVFKTASGAGFRRFALGDGTPLRVISVDDFTRRAVFPGTGAQACVMTLEKGRPTTYPIAWRVYPRGESAPVEQRAEPVDANDATSAWITGDAESIRRVRSIAGASAWRARAGAYTGGANGVFWVEILERSSDGKCLVRNLPDAGLRAVPQVTARIEEGLLFPLLRARDVGRFRANPSGHIVMTQDPAARRGIDPAEMTSRYPLTLDYLERFREPLAARRDRGTRSLIEAGAPFWSIFSVCQETLAEWKVVWRRIASRVEAAVCAPVAVAGAERRPAIPQETCTFVACASEQEAHFLAGLLNASCFNEAARALGQIGGKGFAPPHLLRRIAVPRYDPSLVAHRVLADRARQHGPDLPQGDLDALAAAAWQGRQRLFPGSS